MFGFFFMWYIRKKIITKSFIPRINALDINQLPQIDKKRKKRYVLAENLSEEETLFLYKLRTGKKKNLFFHGGLLTLCKEIHIFIVTTTLKLYF